MYHGCSSNDDSLVLLYVNWANRLCNHISNAFPTDGIVAIVSRESEIVSRVADLH